MKQRRAEARRLAADIDRAAARRQTTWAGAGSSVCDVMGYNYADPQAEAYHKANPEDAR